MHPTQGVGGTPPEMALLRASKTNNAPEEMALAIEIEEENRRDEKTEIIRLASIREVFSFGSGPRKKFGLMFGIIFACVAGAVAPFMIFYFAKSFEDLGADPTSDEYLKGVRDLAFTFLVLGVVAFVSLCAYSTLLETAAGEMTMSLKTQWYQALLRQDLAYFDIQDVSGTATIISINGAKYKRGVGNKLGLFFQFVCTFLGGLIYSFYSSWQTSLVVLLTVPFMAVSGWFLLKMNTSQTRRANASYAEAGSIVYMTATLIRTILSLNASSSMIQKFTAATEKAYQEAVSQVHWLGLANGSIMASFLLSSIAVPLYGGFLLYDQVRSKGCDPSGAVLDVETCDPSGVDIFGALFGIFIGASALPQISNTVEAFTGARAACFLATTAMDRKVEVGDDTHEMGADGSRQVESQGLPIRRQVGTDFGGSVNLPRYAIDSSSPNGKKPEIVEGSIEFKDVVFSFPTRREQGVFDGFSLSIPASKTVAIVGPSGSGKSTIAQLVERFYDPTGGSISLDGTDLRDLNVKWLRQQIGLVSQEPSLFACSIRDNIAHGCPGATTEEIEAAAEVANAHDFIMNFPDGYETQVGDKGGKLSGGQKQRIAIARILIKNPKILVLDEATSALDNESERVVQNAIERLLETAGQQRTTIVIAHRLSTIRNADIIAVVDGGRLIETGSHDQLLKQEGKYYELVQAQQAPMAIENSGSSSLPVAWSDSRSSSSLEQEAMELQSTPVLQFRDVTFKYPSRPDNKVLSGFSLAVRSGETLALVGPSGHGKSTVIQLVERFYDPSEGSIELDGVDLKSLNVRWLRSQVGLVSQEPTLFDTTIAENIKFGMELVTQDQMEQSARDAEAHNFVMSFPDGYQTQVGEGGTQVSGGQKQRICIARALLRHPKLLLLDEATSALDSESERLVQEAFEKIMSLKSQTTIVIAHRLSTIRNADRIAVVVDGKVKELGTYDVLISKEGGHFQRLQALHDLDVEEEEHEAAELTVQQPSLEDKIESMKEKKRLDKAKKEKDEDELEKIGKEKEKQDASRARRLAKDDGRYFCIGVVGAVLAGAMFPAWGFVFAYMIELLYTPVYPCSNEDDCDADWDSVADDMKALSHSIAYASVGTIVAALIGYVLLFYGFGTATEKMNKRVRDAAFTALVRQEVAFFDMHPVGKLTSQFQDDAALIHSFSGEPIRTLVINIASVLVGLIIGFFYMWPFALVFLGILPFMGFGAEMEMRMYLKGEDEGDDTIEDEHSPGGIVIESLLNIRTVASLTMEEAKIREYGNALQAEDPTPIRSNFLKGSGFGLGQFFQFWGLALMFWFGAWSLHTYPDQFEFRDFNISMFGLFFSLYGLTVALEGATDREKAKLAANRIFGLTDRQSVIDPLGEEGLKTTASTDSKVVRWQDHEKHEKSPKHKSKKKVKAADHREKLDEKLRKLTKDTAKGSLDEEQVAENEDATKHETQKSSPSKPESKKKLSDVLSEVSTKTSSLGSSANEKMVSKNTVAAPSVGATGKRHSKRLSSADATASKAKSESHLAVHKEQRHHNKHRSHRDLTVSEVEPRHKSETERADNAVTHHKKQHSKTKKASPDRGQVPQKSEKKELDEDHVKYNSGKKHHSSADRSSPKSQSKTATTNDDAHS